MKGQFQALQAEFLKNRHASVLWATFVAFALAPLMGGVFMLISQDPEALAKSGGFAMKVKAMNFGANWSSYFVILTQAIGVGGIMVFGFAASWIFGREYSDGTTKDLLALPLSRTKILNAKFIVYMLWCLALVASNLLVGVLIGAALRLPVPDMHSLALFLSDYMITTLLTMLAGAPIAFFAMWGKGYLAPLGFVALAIVFAQVISATGYGSYFPWAVPGLYSGAGGDYKKLLDNYSYLILVLTALAGYGAAILYWKFSDQTK